MRGGQLSTLVLEGDDAAKFVEIVSVIGGGHRVISLLCPCSILLLRRY